ncbi:hypothetical protein F8M41_017945 [Gigaspora margarita]|uniref:Uncharacterized protein n=2 Tax=Gigaspora margarita TaxID=4874 RepID=A0A8H4AMA2_GIGMA|nr:hypothetical protein F8M41_017945 [Gigaspora margarita]
MEERKKTQSHRLFNILSPYERRREDENILHHTLFYGLKCFTFGALVVLFLLYLAFMIYKIITDIPIRSTGYDIVDEMNVPDIAICLTSSNSDNIRILRCDLKWTNQTVTRKDNCTDYIIPEVVSLGAHRGSCKIFKANKTIKYTNSNSSLNGLGQIGFYFNIPNISAEETNNIGIASLSIQLTSPDFDPLLYSEQVISYMDKAILSNLQLQWNFVAGMVNYAAVVKFRTIAYKTILPGDVHAIIGLTPNYHTTYFIESDIHYFPFNSKPEGLPNGTSGYFSVAAGTFIQEQTIEHRLFTVFSALASAGAISGVLLGIYAFLFGQYIKPYGYVHSLFNKIPESVFNLEAPKGAINLEASENAIYSEIPKNAINSEEIIKMINERLDVIEYLLHIKKKKK